MCADHLFGLSVFVSTFFFFLQVSSAYEAREHNVVNVHFNTLLQLRPCDKMFFVGQSLISLWRSFVMFLVSKEIVTLISCQDF